MSTTYGEPFDAGEPPESEPRGFIDGKASMPIAKAIPSGWRRCQICMRRCPRNELRAIRPHALACKTCRRIAEQLPAAEIDEWLAWPPETRIYAIRGKFNIDVDRYSKLAPLSQSSAGVTDGSLLAVQHSGAWHYHVPQCFWDEWRRKPAAFTIPPGDDNEPEDA